MDDVQSFLLTLNHWLKECPNDTLCLWMCWGEKKENLIPWLPASLELAFLQDNALGDELITKNETGGPLESGKGCWVTNVHEEAFFPIPHLSTLFQFNSTNV